MKMISTNHLDFHLFEVAWLGLASFEINKNLLSCSTIETVQDQPLEQFLLNH